MVRLQGNQESTLMHPRGRQTVRCINISSQVRMFRIVADPRGGFKLMANITLARNVYHRIYRFTLKSTTSKFDAANRQLRDFGAGIRCKKHSLVPRDVLSG